MSQEFSIRLPFPISVNNMFPHKLIKGKIRRFPSPVYRRWREQAFLMLNAARSRGQVKRFEEPVVVKIQLFPANGRARDVDNLNKGILDALVKARILHDDSSKWVKSVVSWIEDPTIDPGAVVTIRVASLPLFKEKAA